MKSLGPRSNIQDVAIQRQAASAWVTFGVVGGVLTIRDSFNVTSVTRNAAGDYTVNIAAGVLQNANYAAEFSGQDGAGGAFFVGAYGGAWSTTQCRFAHRTGTNLYDTPIASCVIFGGR